MRKSEQEYIQRLKNDEHFFELTRKRHLKAYGKLPYYLLKEDEKNTFLKVHENFFGVPFTKDTFKAYIYIILIFIFLKFITVF